MCITRSMVFKMAILVQVSNERAGSLRFTA